MPSTQVATTLTADTASCGYCFAAALKLLPPGMHLSRVVFFFCGKILPSCMIVVALSAVKKVLFGISHRADRISTAIYQYLLACVDVQSWSFVSFLCLGKQLARRVCTECVEG